MSVLWLCTILLVALSCNARPNMPPGFLVGNAERPHALRRIDLPKYLQDIQLAVSKAAKDASETAKQHVAAMKRKHMEMIRQHFLRPLTPIPYNTGALNPHWNVRPPCVGCLPVKNIGSTYQPSYTSQTNLSPCKGNLFTCLQTIGLPSYRPPHSPSASRPCSDKMCKKPSGSKPLHSPVSKPTVVNSYGSFSLDKIPPNNVFEFSKPTHHISSTSVPVFSEKTTPTSFLFTLPEKLVNLDTDSTTSKILKSTETLEDLRKNSSLLENEILEIEPFELSEQLNKGSTDLSSKNKPVENESTTHELSSFSRIDLDKNNHNEEISTLRPLDHSNTLTALTEVMNTEPTYIEVDQERIKACTVLPSNGNQLITQVVQGEYETTVPTIYKINSLKKETDHDQTAETTNEEDITENIYQLKTTIDPFFVTEKLIDGAEFQKTTLQLSEPTTENISPSKLDNDYAHITTLAALEKVIQEQKTTEKSNFYNLATTTENGSTMNLTDEQSVKVLEDLVDSIKTEPTTLDLPYTTTIDSLLPSNKDIFIDYSELIKGEELTTEQEMKTTTVEKDFKGIEFEPFTEIPYSVTETYVKYDITTSDEIEENTTPREVIDEKSHFMDFTTVNVTDEQSVKVLEDLMDSIKTEPTTLDLPYSTTIDSLLPSKKDVFSEYSELIKGQELTTEQEMKTTTVGKDFKGIEVEPFTEISYSVTETYVKYDITTTDEIEENTTPREVIDEKSHFIESTTVNVTDEQSVKVLEDLVDSIKTEPTTLDLPYSTTIDSLLPANKDIFSDYSELIKGQELTTEQKMKTTTVGKDFKGIEVEPFTEIPYSVTETYVNYDITTTDEIEENTTPREVINEKSHFIESTTVNVTDEQSVKVLEDLVDSIKTEPTTLDLPYTTTIDSLLPSNKYIFSDHSELIKGQELTTEQEMKTTTVGKDFKGIEVEPFTEIPYSVTKTYVKYDITTTDEIKENTTPREVIDEKSHFIESTTVNVTDEQSVKVLEDLVDSIKTEPTTLDFPYTTTIDSLLPSNKDIFSDHSELIKGQELTTEQEMKTTTVGKDYKGIEVEPFTEIPYSVTETYVKYDITTTDEIEENTTPRDVIDDKSHFIESTTVSIELANQDGKNIISLPHETKTESNKDLFETTTLSILYNKATKDEENIEFHTITTGEADFFDETPKESSAVSIEESEITTHVVEVRDYISVNNTKINSSIINVETKTQPLSITNELYSNNITSEPEIFTAVVPEQQPTVSVTDFNEVESRSVVYSGLADSIKTTTNYKQYFESSTQPIDKGLDEVDTTGTVLDQTTVSVGYEERLTILHDLQPSGLSGEPTSYQDGVLKFTTELDTETNASPLDNLVKNLHSNNINSKPDILTTDVPEKHQPVAITEFNELIVENRSEDEDKNITTMNSTMTSIENQTQPFGIKIKDLYSDYITSEVFTTTAPGQQPTVSITDINGLIVENRSEDEDNNITTIKSSITALENQTQPIGLMIKDLYSNNISSEPDILTTDVPEKHQPVAITEFNELLVENRSEDEDNNITTMNSSIAAVENHTQPFGLMIKDLYSNNIASEPEILTTAVSEQPTVSVTDFNEVNRIETTTNYEQYFESSTQPIDKGLDEVDTTDTILDQTTVSVGYEKRLTTLHDLQPSGLSGEPTSYQDGVLKFTTELDTETDASPLDNSKAPSPFSEILQNTFRTVRGKPNLRDSFSLSPVKQCINLLDCLISNSRSKRSERDDIKSFKSGWNMPSRNGSHFPDLSHLTPLTKENRSIAEMIHLYGPALLELLPKLREGYRNDAFSEDDKEVIRSIFGDLGSQSVEEKADNLNEAKGELLMKDASGIIEEPIEDDDYSSEYLDMSPETAHRMKRSRNPYQLISSTLKKTPKDHWKNLNIKQSSQSYRRKVRSSHPFSEAASILALLAEKSGVPDDEEQDYYEYYDDEGSDHVALGENFSKVDQEAYDDEDNEDPSFGELIKLARRHSQRKSRQES